MTPDDFSHWPKHSHPEITDNPEAMQPATEKTKQALLDLVREKSRGGHDDGTCILKSLAFDDLTKGTLNINSYRENASRDNPNRLVGIHRAEWLAELYGERLITNYFILKTPDGLHIEKHTQTSNPRKEWLDDSATMEDVYHAALNGMAKIAELKKAHAAEDELGLSFVSEQEAKVLLSLVQEAHPPKR